MSVTLPEPGDVAARAAEILSAITGSTEYPRLHESTVLYPTCWATFTGYPLVSRFDLQDDAEPLLTEALRVLALKAAVYELTGGDEAVAELPVSAPVDEMVHAVIAQYTLLVRMQRRLGVELVHMTDRERFGWTPGDYTSLCYAEAWGEPPARYWIPAEETRRRRAVLARRYASIGVFDGGARHEITFTSAESAAV